MQIQDTAKEFRQLTKIAVTVDLLHRSLGKLVPIPLILVIRSRKQVTYRAVRVDSIDTFALDDWRLVPRRTVCKSKFVNPSTLAVCDANLDHNFRIYTPRKQRTNLRQTISKLNGFCEAASFKNEVTK